MFKVPSISLRQKLWTPSWLSARWGLVLTGQHLADENLHSPLLKKNDPGMISILVMREKFLLHHTVGCDSTCKISIGYAYKIFSGTPLGSTQMLLRALYFEAPSIDIRHLKSGFNISSGKCKCIFSSWKLVDKESHFLPQAVWMDQTTSTYMARYKCMWQSHSKHVSLTGELLFAACSLFSACH